MLAAPVADQKTLFHCLLYLEMSVAGLRLLIELFFANLLGVLIAFLFFLAELVDFASSFTSNFTSATDDFVVNDDSLLQFDV